LEGQQIAAHAKKGRCRLASIEAGHHGADQGQDSSILNRQSAIDNHQGALTLRDVKNEDRTGYVHENTGEDDKMSSEEHAFYMKMRQLLDNRQQSKGLLPRTCTDYTIIGANWHH
jgi:hypothetical protein